MAGKRDRRGAAAAWRGVFGVDEPLPLFARPPIFSSWAEREEYEAACRAAGSNPHRPRFAHCTSLLTTEAALNEVLLRRRDEVRLALGAARWPSCREFFLNKRDAPLLASGAGLCPVLSQFCAGDSGDVAMPAVEDYVRCWPGRFFGTEAAPAEALPAPLPWSQRCAVAVWRGGATGAGVTPSTNLRLRLVQLCQEWKRSDHPDCLLDAELVSWSPRHKIGLDGVLRVIDPARASAWGLNSVGRRHYLDWRAQRRYKYAVYLDGNVGAARLGALLGLAFVVLAPASAAPAAFLRRRLVAFEHFVPLAADLSDLEEKLLWLRDRDDEAERLSRNARALWEAECTGQAMEEAVAKAIVAMPQPDDARFHATLRHLWQRCRSAVYVLLDDRGGLRAFVPFANEDFQNDWQGPPPSEPAPLSAFLARAEELWGDRVTLPYQRWWTNGASLVCNVMPRGVWGESMLPALQLLVWRAAALLHARLPPSRPQLPAAASSQRSERKRHRKRRRERSSDSGRCRREVLPLPPRKAAGNWER